MTIICLNEGMGRCPSSMLKWGDGEMTIICLNEGMGRCPSSMLKWGDGEMTIYQASGRG